MKKRIWKALITLFTVFCLALSVSACSKDDNQGNTGDGSQIEQDGNQENTGGDSQTEQGSENTQQHTHSYSSLWTSNDTQHWHAATCEHASEKSEIGNHNFVNGVCSVCKYEQPPTIVEITAIYLNKTSLSLYIDDSETLNETVLPVNATESVSWISTAPSVATVENGKVTGISTGTATIIVSSPSGKTATCEVTVAENTYGCTFEKFGNGYAVVGYTGSATTVTVPSTYQGEPVVAIGTYTGGFPIVPDGFAYCNNIETVIIPSTITTINGYAFYNCTSLKELIIPNSVNSLGYNMLYNCNRLQKLSLPFAYFELYSLFDTSANNPTAEKVPNYLAVPKSLKELIITGGTIGEYSFRSCDSLTSVTIGDGVTSIGERAFYGCNSLTNVTIGNGVTSIGECAFWYCDNLTSVTIGDGVTSIGNGAFSTCSRLTSITIPNSVTSIGEYVFVSCRSLTSVTIGKSVTSIGLYAFSLCSSLTSVVFENPNGWRRSSSSSGSSGTAITGLNNPATAATYLKDTYCDYYWKRS